MNDNLLYQEKITSNMTETLFLALTCISFLLGLWRASVDELKVLAIVFFCLFVIFLFYSLNYRMLIIRLTSDSLKLKFGIFTWKVALDNVKACYLDEIPTFMRMGGAGIHFMFIRKRYRASFNFLEYPRVAIALKRKAGPVQDISFSTRRPDEVLRIIQTAMAAEQSEAPL